MEMKESRCGRKDEDNKIEWERGKKKGEKLKGSGGGGWNGKEEERGRG
jgi:hypothetical protein